MARIRSIKPEFFTSLTIGALPPLVRLTFIGLWTYVDDDGRAIDDARLVRAAVCPLDERTAADVESDLRKLADARLIERYEVAGKNYLVVANWTEHQKVSHPRESRYPAPCNDLEVPREDSGKIPEDSGNSPPRGGAEQGAGSREQGMDTTTSLNAGARDIEAEASEIIRTANRGMTQNPAIGDACNPIPTGHGSRQAVLDWLSEGIPAELAGEVVLQRAQEYQPGGTRRQITTMLYFDGAVRDAHSRAQATGPPGKVLALRIGPRAERLPSDTQTYKRKPYQGLNG